jgi:hypothetical protein
MFFSTNVWDRRFAKHIRAIEVRTVGKAWVGTTNGKLLALALARRVRFFHHCRPESVIATAFTQIQYGDDFAQGEIKSCQRPGGPVA